MKRDDVNRLQEIVVESNFHRDSEHERSLSVTTLLGPAYKAAKRLHNVPKTNVLPAMKMRSAAIGTGFHLLAEKVLGPQLETDVIVEEFTEEYIAFADLWLSGTYDAAIFMDDTQEFELGDFKTGYGNTFKSAAKTTVQMSMYRWLNRKKLDIGDTGHVWWVSQSNNAMEHHAVELMTLDHTTKFIKERIQKVLDVNFNDQNDCQYDANGEKIPFNMCSWCEYLCDQRK